MWGVEYRLLLYYIYLLAKLISLVYISGGKSKLKKYCSYLLVLVLTNFHFKIAQVYIGILSQTKWEMSLY